MQRQCAWCLRLMDSVGEPTTLLHVPKIYEASHGMCRVCGNLWLEQVIQDTEKLGVLPALPLLVEIKN